MREVERQKKCMMTKKLRIGIRYKLIAVFLLFVCIFYGTLALLFTNTQKIVGISERIVNKNNQIVKLSQVMYDSLLGMEVNDKKYRLLNKDVYRSYFLEGKAAYEDSLAAIFSLASSQYTLSPVWKELDHEYRELWQSLPVGEDGMVQADRWAPEATVNGWLGKIKAARRDSEAEIERALLDIHDRSKRSVQNGMIGLIITIVVGIAAALFLSRSIIGPLHKLREALYTMSQNRDTIEIDIQRNDEFGDLAATFNEMSRQLKAEDELRAEFIATLSHEIRTPLASIRESVNMMLEGILGPINEKQQKFLEIAGSEIKRISDLLNYLLHVSRLDAESRSLAKEKIDPNLLIDEVASGLTPKAGRKGVVVTVQKMTERADLLGVKKELQQVLFNLLDNAVKFSPKNSEVHIFLSLDEQRHTLTYTIADQGPGVVESEKTLIFSKYYRGQAVRKVQDGVGLGLSISQRIVHSHGGELYVENNKDAGCSFFCTFPCVLQGEEGAEIHV